MKTLLGIVTFEILICTALFVNGNIDNMIEFSDDEEHDCIEMDDPALPYIYIPWNIPYRAYKTVPPGLQITDSKIEGSGTGIISDIFIKKFTWLGEYEGEVITNLEEISDYAWKVKRGGDAYFYVDAYYVRTSNWLRWINCSRYSSEENILMLECRGRVFYITIKDIHPGQELLVYYGDNYALDLDIDVDNYYNNTAVVSSPQISEQKNCTECH